MLKKIVCSLLFFTISLAWAEYPESPITIIVPSKAGGGTDTTARIFIEAAGKQWPDAEFVVKNVSGSGGQKGFEEIADADKDGYTIGMIFTTQVVSHIVSGRARYTLDSFHVLGNAAQDASIVVVPKDSGIKSLSDLAETAKSNELTAAVNGIGSDDYIAAKSFEKLAGVTFNLLPTNGSTEQKAGILGGHFDVSFMNLSQMIKQHIAGDARIIGILTKERDSSLPDIATGEEQGYPVYMTATRGFVNPAGLEDGVQEKLTGLFDVVLNDEGFLTRSIESFITPLPMSGPDYLSYLQELQTSTKEIYDQAPW